MFLALMFAEVPLDWLVLFFSVIVSIHLPVLANKHISYQYYEPRYPQNDFQECF